MVTGPGVDYGIMHVPNTYRAVTKSQLYHHPKTLLAQRSVSPRRRSSYKTLQFPVVAPPLQGGSVSFPWPRREELPRRRLQIIVGKENSETNFEISVVTEDFSHHQGES